MQCKRVFSFITLENFCLTVPAVRVQLQENRFISQWVDAVFYNEECDRIRTIWMRWAFCSRHTIEESHSFLVQNPLAMLNLFWAESISSSLNIMAITLLSKPEALDPARWRSECIDATSSCDKSILCWAALNQTRPPSHLNSYSVNLVLNSVWNVA